MAKARAIVKRRKAVRNIRKITQTMQLIATARYQRCLQRALAGKPYTEQISAMIATLAASGGIEHPLLEARPQADTGLLLILTSNRGLCGAYNANVLRTALEHDQALRAEGLAVRLEVVGKKGAAYLRFLRRAVAETVTDIEDRVPFARVAQMADRYMAAYTRGELRRVDVAYMRFLSVGTQRPVVEPLLPIRPPQDAPPAAREFELRPSAAHLLDRLLPQAVRTRLYQYFNDAIVSEQVARMVAMKAATDAASEMIKYLTRRYNRARQTQITLELADIVGGAEAVSR